MDAMSLTTSSHTMSPSQSLPVQPHFISLHNFEMSVVDCMTKLDDGQWSCKICDERFDDIIMLVFHLLSSHNNASTTTTFSNAAVIHICMLLEESESMGMFQSYVQVAAGDLDTDTESEVRTSPAHHTFVQAIREPQNIVSGLPCSPWKHSSDLQKYNRDLMTSRAGHLRPQAKIILPPPQFHYQQRHSGSGPSGAIGLVTSKTSSPHTHNPAATKSTKLPRWPLGTPLHT